MGNFAKSMGSTHATAVEVIDGLVKKKLVWKTSKIEDRRVTILQVTEKGRETLEIIEKWGKELELFIEEIPESTMDSLEKGLHFILMAMRKEGHLIMAEPCAGCVYFQPHAREGEEPHFCQMIEKYLSQDASSKECPEHTPIVE